MSFEGNTLCFLNILKPLGRNFMKPCTHIHIDGANIMIKHKGLGAISVELFPFVILIGCVHMPMYSAYMGRSTPTTVFHE